MSNSQPHVYRFVQPEHWSCCLLDGFEHTAGDNALTQISAVGQRARRVSTLGPVGRVAAGRNGVVLWRIDVADTEPLAGRFDDDGRQTRTLALAGMLTESPRWVLERRALWAFRAHPAELGRFDRHTFEADFFVGPHTLAQYVDPGADAATFVARDIATDGHGGVWLLARTASRHDWLVHVDCEGRPRQRLRVPCEAGAIAQIGAIQRAQTLVLLDQEGISLWLMDLASGKLLREVRLDEVVGGWEARRLSTDGANAIAVGGVPIEHPLASWSMLVFDGTGALRAGPLDRLFDAAGSPAPRPADLAVQGDTVWFAMADGLWRLDSSPACEVPATVSHLLSPALHSPIIGTDRGWLRADLFVDLPLGATIVADYVSTSDDLLAAEMVTLAADTSQTDQRRAREIWDRLAASASDPVVIENKADASTPVSVPLSRSSDSWLWLRLSVTTPPGAPRPRIVELRVLYPDRGLDQYLPRMFRSADPVGGDFLRRLVGVLGATTNSLDDRIASIGSHVDPASAPDDWLDALGSWLDLPWDSALPVERRRALLRSAGPLLAQRGTRAGMLLLLGCVLGEDATVELRDVTVEHPLVALGSRDSPGPRFPLLLTGASPRIAVLGGASRLNGTALACSPNDADPLRCIRPTLSIVLDAPKTVRASTEPVLPALLAQYVPAGLCVRIRWKPARVPALMPPDGDGMVLDAEGPGVLDDDCVIGRTVIVGTLPGKLGRDGLTVGFRIQ
ncbi:phage tail-like protein [Paraburkholderia sp. BL27I4N3]|uniref:phage tail protein n=1 Tax=Paraburkholderia sp. BL27I4N3 TaxID=1938805 RepID=UPI000E38F374|nr:phage tail protein [Paraburkholderia sp. BL27I4N3]REE18414.1 phage tail-like protein [Paraburkholderia sp. BL27I4N3]